MEVFLTCVRVSDIVTTSMCTLLELLNVLLERQPLPAVQNINLLYLDYFGTTESFPKSIAGDIVCQ